MSSASWVTKNFQCTLWVQQQPLALEAHTCERGSVLKGSVDLSAFFTSANTPAALTGPDASHHQICLFMFLNVTIAAKFWEFLKLEMFHGNL